MYELSALLKRLIDEPVKKMSSQIEKMCEQYCERRYPGFKARVRLKIDITPLVSLEMKLLPDKDPNGKPSGVA